MEVKESSIAGLKIITPGIFSDFRGQSVETYSERTYRYLNQYGETIKFLEDDVSISRYSVLRGLHGDTKTWKLIQCLWGEVFFVVLDMRRDSPSYLKWESYELNDENRLQILIPSGCVNGHLCLSEKCLFSYKQSEYYDGAAKQITVKWNDPKFNIPWPLQQPILSKRDAEAAVLRD